MRTCHQHFAHCFGGLLGPHFNTLDLFASSSIHLASFLHVDFIFLSSLSSEGVPECLLGDRPGCVGRKRSLLGWVSRAALPVVKPRAGEQMRQRWQRCLPQAALCNQLSPQRHALRPRAWGLAVPASPFFRHLRVRIRVYVVQQKAGLELLKCE